jgi:hypothetical protein
MAGTQFRISSFEFPEGIKMWSNQGKNRLAGILSVCVLLTLFAYTSKSSSQVPPEPTSSVAEKNFELKGFSWRMRYEEGMRSIQNRDGYFRVFMLEHPVSGSGGNLPQLFSLTEDVYDEWFFRKCDKSRPWILHSRFALYGVSGVTAIKWSLGGLKLQYIVHSPFKFYDGKKHPNQILNVDRGEGRCPLVLGMEKDRYFSISKIDHSNFRFYYFQGFNLPEDIDKAIPIFTQQYGNPRIEKFISRTSDSSIENYKAEWLLVDGTKIRLTKYADRVPYEPWRATLHTEQCAYHHERIKYERDWLTREYSFFWKEDLARINMLLRSDDQLRSPCNFVARPRVNLTGEILIIAPEIEKIVQKSDEKRKSDF